MAEETITTVEEMNNEQYIAAIEEMKANSVSRDAYNKLRNENKQLLDALVSGKEIDQKPEEKKTAQELRQSLFGENELTNLEYVKTALSLRDVLIENGERDPFLPYGDKVDLTAEHVTDAEMVANALRDLVDEADGDAATFNYLYQQRVSDPYLPNGRAKRR